MTEIKTSKKVLNLRDGGQLSLFAPSTTTVKNQLFAHRFRALYVLNDAAVSSYSFKTITKINWSSQLFQWREHSLEVKQSVATKEYLKLLKIACHGLFAESYETGFTERWSETLRAFFFGYARNTSGIIYYTPGKEPMHEIIVQYDAFSLSYLCTNAEIAQYMVPNRDTPTLTDDECKMMCLCLSLLEVNTCATALIEAI